MTRIPLAVATSLLLLLGCEKQSSTPATPTQPKPAPSGAAPAPAHSAPAAAPAAQDGVITAMNLSFRLPEGWKQNPPSNSMRLAEAAFEDPSGDAAKACVAAFSSAGGDVQSNIARWANQVQDASGQPLKPESKQRTVAGLPVHTVTFTGTYLGMGDGAPKSDWTLAAAIVETPQGLLFIKMTGPADRMKAAAPGFESLVDSMAGK
mgnify:CR=1 FL=1